MEDELKPILARQMEVYAGFMEHTDHHVDDFGTPAAFNHYAVGWAHAMNTPYQWTKQVASHWGGTRNGTIIHWPNGFDSGGETRHQFGHVIDIAPTILRAAGIPEPITVNGFDQHPYEGFALNDTFDDAAEVHETQYFEIVVNRGIYHKGWTAVSQHSIPWTTGVTGPPVDEDVWELYAPDDWTQSNDIPADQPDQLRRLQQLFLSEAARHNAFPLDDRRAERHRPRPAAETDARSCPGKGPQSPCCHRPCRVR